MPNILEYRGYKVSIIQHKQGWGFVIDITPQVNRMGYSSRKEAEESAKLMIDTFESFESSSEPPITANDPAFPGERIINDQDGERRVSFEGMTKRENIAALAMHGFLSHGCEDTLGMEEICVKAVKYADGLISQLNKTS